MPLKLLVGVTRKIGLPNYGSAGASCNLEADIDGSLVFADLSAFQSEVQRAFEACRRAVTDELANHRGAMCHHYRPAKVNGLSTNGAGTNRLDPYHDADNEPSPATDRQIKYVRDLACQIPSLGVERLDALAEKMFAKPVAELTASEASRMIEMLREIKLGNPRLPDVLNGESV
jgi:hypothetical protein